MAVFTISLHTIETSTQREDVAPAFKIGTVFSTSAHAMLAAANLFNHLVIDNQAPYDGEPITADVIGKEVLSVLVSQDGGGNPLYEIINHLAHW